MLNLVLIVSVLVTLSGICSVLIFRRFSMTPAFAQDSGWSSGSAIAEPRVSDSKAAGASVHQSADIAHLTRSIYAATQQLGYYRVFISPPYARRNELWIFVANLRLAITCNPSSPIFKIHRVDTGDFVMQGEAPSLTEAARIGLMVMIDQIDPAQRAPLDPHSSRRCGEPVELCAIEALEHYGQQNHLTRAWL